MEKAKERTKVMEIEAQAMSFKKRNQNNVVQFPGKENLQLIEQKKEMAGLVVLLEKIMDGPMWDIQPFHHHHLELLSNFGEGITFTPRTSQRLIANLSTEVLKRRQVEEEPY